MNKIIKIYRNYHKKRDLNSNLSTRNNTDRLQENNSLKNLLSQKNLNNSNHTNNINNNNNNTPTIKSHSIIQKNNNTCIYIGNRDSLGLKNGFGIEKWEDGSKFSCIFALACVPCPWLLRSIPAARYTPFRTQSYDQ